MTPFNKIFFSKTAFQIVLYCCICFQSGLLAENLSGRPAQGTMGLLPRFSMFKLTTADLQNGVGATLVSRMNSGLDLVWELATERMLFTVYADIVQSQLNPPTDSLDTSRNKELQNNRQVLGGGGLGVGFFPFTHHDFSLTLMHSYHQVYFFHAGASSSVLVMDRVTLPELGLRAALNFFRLGFLTVGGNATVTSVFSTSSANQDIRHGYGVEGRITGSFEIDPSFQIELSSINSYFLFASRSANESKIEIGALAGIRLTLD